LSKLSLMALGGEANGSGDDLAANLERAVRVYLSDGDLGRPGWAYPEALREASPGEVEMELSFDRELWRALQGEAAEQGISASKLAGHAALYYTAELDAGRITQRVLDGLGGEDGEDG
jgi:hypothetical protein